ncbi:MAG: hypothetical protein ABIO05_09600, partial [Ferruginibacter sp.]
TSHRVVFDTSQKIFKDFSSYENQIEKAVQHLVYYFPKYKYPHKIITYIGPLDGFGDILSEEAFIIGLQHHLGNFSLYQTEFVRSTYPEYISDRFKPDYIAVNCMKIIIDDMYPEKFEDKSLILQMVENGKRLYVLTKLLPDEEEFKLIGYKEKQLKEAYASERTIWDLFVQNNFLQTLDNNIIKNYVGESPKTMEFGESSPGNIGTFAGWQIVKKYMANNPAMGLDALMQKDAEVIFQEAKYKP